MWNLKIAVIVRYGRLICLLKMVLLDVINAKKNGSCHTTNKIVGTAKWKGVKSIGTEDISTDQANNSG